MRKRSIWRTLKCTELNCKEYGRWEFSSQAEYMRHVKSVSSYTCCRHSMESRVLSVQRLKVEWISDPSRPLKNSPEDPYRSFGSHGVIIGHGYYAEGRDFPVGTRIKITAEVILPEGVENA